MRVTRHLYRTILLALAAAAVASCQPNLTPAARTGSPQERRSSQSIFRRPAPAVRDSITRLITRLSSLNAKYVHPSYSATTWVFSDERDPVFRGLVAFGDSAIGPLVDCIGDAHPTNTTIAGQPVLTGVLCAEALGRIIYHEETDSSGDIDPNWPGYVSPRANATDLQRAQRAWRTVVQSGAFRRA